MASSDMGEVTDPYHYENEFYRTSSPARIGKLLAHSKLYEQILTVPGAVVECGVFKGNSLFRWASFRTLFDSSSERPIVAFDTFADFPSAIREDDRHVLSGFLRDAGSLSLSEADIHAALDGKGCGENVELVAGDLLQSLPRYVGERPALRVALLHVDVDLYEPTCVVLEQLVPRLSTGGVCVLDDYGIFPGATDAIDRYCLEYGYHIQKFSYVRSPSYFVKQ